MNLQGTASLLNQGPPGQTAERADAHTRQALAFDLGGACSADFPAKQGSSAAEKVHMPLPGRTTEYEAGVKPGMASAFRGAAEQGKGLAAVQSAGVSAGTYQQRPSGSEQQRLGVDLRALGTGREEPQVEAGSAQEASGLEHTIRGAPASDLIEHWQTASPAGTPSMNKQAQLAREFSIAATGAFQRRDVMPALLDAQRLRQQPIFTGSAAVCNVSSSVDAAAGEDACNDSHGNSATIPSPGMSCSAQGTSQQDPMPASVLATVPESAACSVAWRSKRKAACLEPAQTGKLHAHAVPPQKRADSSQGVPPPSCQASETASERGPVTEQQHHHRKGPLSSFGPADFNLDAPVQRSHEQASRSADFPMHRSKDASDEGPPQLPQQTAKIEQSANATTNASQLNECTTQHAAAADAGHSPAWMAEQVRALAEKSVAAPLPGDWEGGGLIGRSVAFVLLEDFDAGGQTILRGIKTGRCDPYP